MSLKIFSIDEKIGVVDKVVNDMRRDGLRYTQEYSVMAVVAKDLRARRDFPRNNTLGSLEREIKTAIANKNGSKPGYEDGHMIHLGNMVVSRWPTISQALELFGEESAE